MNECPRTLPQVNKCLSNLHLESQCCRAQLPVVARQRAAQRVVVRALARPRCGCTAHSALARSAPASSAVRCSTGCRWSYCCCAARSAPACRPVPCRAPASLARAALAHPVAPDLALCSATCIGEHAASQQQLRLPAVPLHAAASRVAGSGVARKRRSGLPCCSRSYPDPNPRASLAWRIALRKRFSLACS